MSDLYLFARSKMEKLQRKIFQEVLRDSHFPCNKLARSLSAIIRACNLVVQDAKAIWYQEFPVMIVNYLTRFGNKTPEIAERVARYYLGRAGVKNKQQKDQQFLVSTPLEILRSVFDGNITLDIPYNWGKYDKYSANMEQFAALEERAQTLNEILEMHRIKTIEILPAGSFIENSNRGYLTTEEQEKLVEECNGLSKHYIQQLNLVMKRCLVAYSEQNSATYMLRKFLDIDKRNERVYRVKGVSIPLK